LFVGSGSAVVAVTLAVAVLTSAVIGCTTTSTSTGVVAAARRPSAQVTVAPAVLHEFHWTVSDTRLE
jgi:hypothetical protein